MCEIKRILLNKGLLILLFALLAINAVFFIRENTDTEDREYASADYRKSYDEFYEKVLAEYKDLNIEQGYEKITVQMQDVMADIGESAGSGTGRYTDYKRAVYGNIYEQLSYLKGYATKYEKILENRDALLGSKELAEKNSFSADNIEKTVAAVFSYTCFVIAEYLLYAGLDNFSSFRVLKYVNLFSALNAQKTLAEYVNLNIFNHAAGKNAVLFALLSVGLVLMGICIIFLGRRRPFSRQKRELFGNIGARRSSLLLHEGYKLLWNQKALLFLLLFIVFLYTDTRPETVYYDYRNDIYNQYMTLLSGEVTDFKLSYLENEAGIWEERKEEAFAQIEEEYAKGEEINTRYIESLQKKIENFETAQETVLGIYDDGLTIIKLNEQGLHARYVNSIGYDMYIGYGGEWQNNLDAFYLLFFAIFTTACVWSAEKQSDMLKIIKAAPKGRGSLLLRKTALVMAITFVGNLAVFLLRLYQFKETYGMENMDAGIQSLELFRDLSVDISIGTMLLAGFVLRLLCLWSVVGIMGCVSYLSKNNMYSLSINTILFALPGFLYCIGTDTVKYISPVKCISLWSLYLDNRESTAVFFVAVLFLMLLGLAAYICQYGLISGKSFHLTEKIHCIKLSI